MYSFFTSYLLQLFFPTIAIIYSDQHSKTMPESALAWFAILFANVFIKYYRLCNVNNHFMKAQDTNGATTSASALNSEAPFRIILLAMIKPLILQPVPMVIVP